MSATPPRPHQLVTVTATVRAAEITPLGHLACRLDAPEANYSAIGDPIVASLVELKPGMSVRAVLLRLRCALPSAPWQWQLLCCRVVEAGARPTATTDATTVHFEGNLA
ncbi:MAG: hypothetical protein H0U56_07765 [Methylibium sp.]|uniref:hypothetical protein n=1 Tax=Methylibium sp. TaxID=2067992 RepID=UPI00178F7150|nr:hypothetical protein [Methylibium sp.]MBA2722784.1 hypothetical protein [Methylibium sp.]MBA3591065.1 hypothetical protein [Methylibium sp.]